MQSDYKQTKRMNLGSGAYYQHGSSGTGGYQSTIPMSDFQHYPPSTATPRAETEILRPREPGILAWLAVVDGPYAGHIFRLNPDATIIGRDPSCDIVLDDTAVSRQHAKIRVVKEKGGEPTFILHDMASENGTFVNGEEIVKYELKDGDCIRMGRTKLVFKQAVFKQEEC